MSSHPGVFAAALGAQFATLAPAVRSVHGGRSLVLHGSVTVTRGQTVLARLLCWLGRLPAAQRDAPARVNIEVFENHERWTRYFGTSPAFRSVLCCKDALLVERMGPLAFCFALRAAEGAVVWDLVRVKILGVPLPRSAVRGVKASAREREGRYRFDIAVALPVVGDVIAYCGELTEASSTSS